MPHRLLQVAMQWPARRSQGCEVARVLNLLDTARSAVFPWRHRKPASPNAVRNPLFLNRSEFPVTFRLFSASVISDVDPFG